MEVTLELTPGAAEACWPCGPQYLRRAWARGLKRPRLQRLFICHLHPNRQHVFLYKKKKNTHTKCFKEKDIVPITKTQLSFLLSPLPFPWRWHDLEGVIFECFFTQPCPVNHIPACVPFHRHAHQAPSQVHLLRMSYLKKFFYWSIVVFLQHCAA